MTTPLRVLHVEDSVDDSVLVMNELRKGGFDLVCERVESPTAFKTALETGDWDVVISDFSLPGYSGLAALEEIKQSGKDIPFILVSGTIGERGAVEVMRAGARDYVLKDHLGRLPLAVDREVREAALRASQRKMTERLAISERMASAGMLAAGVAHEINNPLAVIMANLDYLTMLVGQRVPKPHTLKSGRRAENRDAELVTFDAALKDTDGPLQDAREAALRIRAIVSDVAMFSGPRDEELGPVDVKVVIESSIRMAWNEIRHRAELVREFGDVPWVRSNEARLGQVVLNVLVNAAHSMPEGRVSQNVIRIVTKTAKDGRVVIEVRDSGAGIPKEILGRIFDPFFTTKAIGVGTGLGLALCHRMMTDLGGEIAVETEVGKGSLFRLTLPPATCAPQPVPEIKPVQIARERARVMVIDDEVAVGRALARRLSRDHDVVSLTSGKEALARIAAGERFDAILSDLMMPEMTGMDIYEELMRVAPEQAHRMIFVTGGAFTPRARAFLAEVPNPHLEKPFDIASILGIIAASPRMAAAEAERQKLIGQIDTNCSTT